MQGAGRTPPPADRGRGKLYWRFGKRGKVGFYLSSANFPGTIDRKRFQTLTKTTASRWGLTARRWTGERRGGLVDGFNVAGFSARVPDDTLGVQTDFIRDGVVIERDLELNAGQNWAAGPDYPGLDRRSTSRACCCTNSGAWPATRSTGRSVHELADGQDARRR